MKRTIILTTLILLSAIIFAAPRNHKCPLCSGIMMWTGESKTEWGKLTYKMKCTAGHVSWEVDENNNSSSQYNNKNGCQYDGYNMFFTGKTKTEWGKLLKEYKCPAGHTEWRSQ